MSLAVRGGWDTDCNGASVGSVIGALHGARAVGRHWLEPLHDEVRSAIFGFERCAISDLAARTVRIARSTG